MHKLVIKLSVYFSICSVSGGITSRRSNNVAQRTLITLKRENNGSKLHRHSTFPYVVGNRLNFMICPIFLVNYPMVHSDRHSD